MPLHNLKESPTPEGPRFRIAMVGKGPALAPLARLLTRPDFIASFPRVKVVGWVPEPNSSALESEWNSVPEVLRKLIHFPDIPSLFLARPGTSLALDLSVDSRHTESLRAAAPPATAIAGHEAVLRFCAAAEEGKLAIGGGESLRNAQSIFATIVDQMEDDILILDQAGIILDMNRHAAEERGKERTDYLGKPCAELDPTLPCFDEKNCPFLIAQKTAKKAERIFSRVMPDGRVRTFTIMCYPLVNSLGAVTQILYMRRDVTEQRHLEQRLQQAEKMAAVGELSTYIAHEIRNPLFAIGGFANALLRSTSLDENAQEKVRIILEESRRLDGILKNIINFARPMEQEMGLVDAGLVARQTMDLMTMGCGERGIRTVAEIADDLPKVYGNADNLKQCLINLVKNALEAMPDGGTLTVRAFRNGDQVQLEVEDTGVGIPPELQEIVFSPFYSTKHGGAGLGLAMTRKVAEEMGGKTLLASQVGQGTLIILLLPAALAIGRGGEAGPDGRL